MSLCTVTGTLLDETGTPLAPGIAVTFWAAVPQAIPTVTMLVDKQTTVITDNTGAISIALQRNSLARIQCADAGLDMLRIGIPDAASADLATLVASALAQPPVSTSPFALESDLLAEVARAEGAEATLATSVTTEATTRAAADTVNATAIATETTRAEGVEDTIAGNLNDTNTTVGGINTRVTTLESAGYQTAAQVNTAITGALASYVTTTALDAALAGYVTTGTLASYSTTTAMNTAIAAAITATGVTSANTVTGDWNVSGHVIAGDGSQAAPGLAFAGDPSTGWFRLSSNILVGVVAGNIRIAISGSFVQYSVNSMYIGAAADLSLNNLGSGILGVSDGTNSIGLQTVPPATSSAAGIKGQIAVDSGFIYVCSATNTWVRAALLPF